MVDVSVTVPDQTLTIDLRIFPLPVVKRAGYRMADQCTIVLGPLVGDLISVALNFPTAATQSAQRAALDTFHRHLIDEDLRAQIRADTTALREVILAHTFSMTDILSR